EPVFADSDISGQFPDVVLRTSGGRAWAVETTGQQGRNGWGADRVSQSSGNGQPWDVEMWSRGRRRIKHFNGYNYNPQSGYASSNSMVPVAVNYTDGG